jgi:AraC family transcriptional regulator
MDLYDRYSYFKIPSEFLLENLVTSDAMGHTQRKDFFYDRNYFNNNVVMFVLSGLLHVEQNGHHFQLKSGEGILMKLTAKHKYYADKKATPSFLWFHFKGKALQPMLDILDKKDLLPLVFTSENMKEKITALFAITKIRSVDYEFVLSEKIYSIILEITKSPLLNICKGDGSSSFVFYVKRYIEDHIGTKLDLDTLSKAFGLDKSYFCRKFKTHFKTSPMNYIINQRIEISKKMLCSSNEPLSHIAAQLGFYDQAHFSKVFKSSVGCSPLIYKNESCF